MSPCIRITYAHIVANHYTMLSILQSAYTYAMAMPMHSSKNFAQKMHGSSKSLYGFVDGFFFLPLGIVGFSSFFFRFFSFVWVFVVRGAQQKKTFDIHTKLCSRCTLFPLKWSWFDCILHFSSWPQVTIVYSVAFAKTPQNNVNRNSDISLERST